MNGLGNEIVVVDMRGTAARDQRRGSARRRAAAGAPFDQMMALLSPRAPGTDAYVRIYNSDGSAAGRLRQRHALHRRADVAGDRQARRSTFETKAGLLELLEGIDR